jgi:hypothetical protein
MVRTTGAQIGLLAFAVAVVAGVYANNPATVVMLRALAAMVVAALVGQVAGWTAKLVLRDHLQRRKLRIDREHFDAMRNMTGTNAPDAAEARSEPA